MEKHVHPGEEGSHGEGCQVLTVLDVDCGATLHGHVKHVDVVVYNHDVGHGTPVRVGKVAVAALKLHKCILSTLKIFFLLYLHELVYI